MRNFPWQSRDPNGRINVASVLDVQDFYLSGKFIGTKLPAERLVDNAYIDNAVQKLGPFELENKDSRAEGVPLDRRSVRHPQAGGEMGRASRRVG